MKIQDWEFDLSEAVTRFWKPSDHTNHEFDPDDAEKQLLFRIKQIDEQIGRILGSGSTDLCMSMRKVKVNMTLQVYAIIANLSVLGLQRLEEIEAERELLKNVELPKLDL